MVGIDTHAIAKAELVPMLTAAAVNIAIRVGVKEQVKGELGTHFVAIIDDIHVMYRTPSSMIFTAPTAFGVDIWHGRKCFSVVWDSQLLKDYQIVNFKRGPWIPKLLSFSERLNS